MPIGQSTTSKVNRDRARYAKMKQRCLNPNDAAYKDYGGRGIKICSGWGTFEEFYRDMGGRPTPQHSLDRKNNDGHYSCGRCSECTRNNWPMNCRWATPFEQGNNTRANVWLTKDGKTLTITGWARELNVNPATLLSRHSRGYPPDKILAPVRKRRVFERKPRGFTSKGSIVVV